ncbi:MAG: DUF3726 domain-containing protein [Pseudomonadota bacterium]
MVAITLAEVESSIRKCAQAKQFSWGLSEEAGKSARWLAAFGLPGPEQAYAYLAGTTGNDSYAMRPNLHASSWRSVTGALCPIIGGAAVSDRIARILQSDGLTLENVVFPTILMGIVGQTSRVTGVPISISFSETPILCVPEGIVCNVDEIRFPEHAKTVIITRFYERVPQVIKPKTGAYSVDSSLWADIDALASETYAPATEESRSGAGAGLTDND